ncbi:hypothetical protein KKE26_07035 [bacterium]|nr:hypothetical protein [bacterium]MBU1754359.1 hypothetical protein [bacterium]
MIEKQIGQMLVDSGIITDEQLQQALKIQQRDDKRLGRVLVELGFVSDVTMIEFLSHQVGLMVEKCEQRYPELFQKEHTPTITQKQATHAHSKHSDIMFSRLELEQGAGKRIDASEQRLIIAKKSLQNSNYNEVFVNAYSAIHHLAQAAKYLTNFIEFRGHEMEGMKFVNTGRTGVGQVRRIPIVSESLYSQKPGTVDKKKVTMILATAQDYFVKIKAAFEEEMQKYNEEAKSHKKLA